MPSTLSAVPPTDSPTLVEPVPQSLSAPNRRSDRARAAATAWARDGAPAHLALVVVLAFTAVLELHRLAQNSYANIFYSAAVRSELRSLHNFLYLSFDPGGLISVDKPPLGVWLQVLSAKLFGFHPMSLLVPEAIVAILTVAVLYRIVSLRYGRWAGVVAALALAVFPSFAAVGRDNNTDALLVLFMLLGCGAGLRAVETGRWRSLLLCAVWLGLAFNTKTLAAYLVVPGIALAFALCTPGPIVRRLGQLAVAGILLAAISFSWVAFVDLTPAHQRPYVGSSTDNTELGLTFSYNGVGRVGGQFGGPTELPGGPGRPVIRRTNPASAGVPPIPRHGRSLTPVAFGGPTGPTRLFGAGLGDQGGWLVPFAAIGAMAMALAWWLAVGPLGAAAAAPPGRRRDPRLAALLVLGGWFAVEAAVLSFSKGIVHPYYVSALGPGMAALVGAGAVEMVRLRRQAPWWWTVAALAIACSLGAQFVIMRRENYLLGTRPVLAAAAAVALALFAFRRTAGWAMAAGVGLLIAIPAAYCTTLWDAPVQSTFPAAGPHQTAGHGGVGLTPVGEQAALTLIAYVRAHRPGTRWPLLTVSSTSAAPYILLGLPAGALAGYGGTDPALSGPGLARLVARGEARHVLLGGPYAGRGGNGATRAVQLACREISRLQGRGLADALARGRVMPLRRPPPLPKPLNGRFRTLGALTLFDCGGRVAALAAHNGPA
jgi:4-amino-4-deoxy-L-arabinose transferase-like glycosyltransferase